MTFQTKTQPEDLGLEGTRNNIISLSLAVARRIVGKAVELDPTVLESIYRQTMDAARDFSEATVFVHPLDRKLVAVDALAEKKGFKVESSTHVGRSGCRIVHGETEIDARLDVLLESIKNHLKGPMNV